jgi:SP family facilitated glucose transporter-like MFS transporter 8
MAALSFGLVIGYTSPALPQMTAKDGPLDESSASWFGSLMTIGGMLGCPLAGFLVQRVGRKATLLINVLPYLVGWGLIMMCSDISFLCFGRMLTGLGCGMSTVCSPMFIAEISTKELRGMLGSGVQLAIVTGILLAYAVGMAVTWRSLALFAMCIPICAALMTLKVIDTPHYYLSRGQKHEALRALSWLRAPGADVDEECRDMEESQDADNEKVSWRDFTKQELYLPLRVSVGLMIFQQLSGINVIMFYTVSIFQSAGYKESGNLATVVVGIVQFVITIVACMLMDRAGRRVLLFISGLGMAVTCFTMGYYYQQASESLSWLALASLIVYIIAFSIGWGPIPMLIMSEIFPLKARGAASAIASVSNWLFAFIVTKEFYMLQTMLGQHGVFWLYSLCCVIGVTFVWKFVPETKGKSLEDIELYFLGRAIMTRKTPINL